MHIYIYMYIWVKGAFGGEAPVASRALLRRLRRSLYIYMYVCMCVCMYVYIYI